MMQQVSKDRKEAVFKVKAGSFERAQLSAF